VRGPCAGKACFLLNDNTMVPTMITVEELSSRLVMHFKMVRLTALQDTPTAFASTYSRESKLSDEDWLTRVSTWNSDRSTCYLAMEKGAPCGIIAGKCDEHDLQRAHVLSMWVAPTHRRTGLGSRLVSAVQSWAQNLGVHELRLMVTSTNATAIRFYEKCGFTLTGVSQPFPNHPALSESEMLKPIKNSNPRD
jgi:ribosomal protein S18 acetylase RimI-like enzyme